MFTGIGFPIPLGTTAVMKQVPEIVAQSGIPTALAITFTDVLTEIKSLTQRIKTIEQQLMALTHDNDEVRRLRQIQGIGLLTSTAIVAAAGSPHHFKSGRYFAAWLGLTPREFSSGNRRLLGRISKQGDRYLRMLIIHGARSVLAWAKQVVKQPHARLSHLQRWAVQLEQRAGHNKATVALANKLARIVWATWKYERDFDGNYADRFAIT